LAETVRNLFLPDQFKPMTVETCQPRGELIKPAAPQASRYSQLLLFIYY